MITFKTFKELKPIIKYKLDNKIHDLYRKDKVSDKFFLSVMYWIYNDRFINWRNPSTINEKIQWTKLYNRRMAYVPMIDKLKSKDFIAERIGGEYVVPLYKVWNTPEEVELEGLPEKFVIKCNHGSGDTYIHTGRRTPNLEEIKNFITPKFYEKFHKLSGEWLFSTIDRKVFAEAYLEDNSPLGLPDYKFFCFNGVPTYIQVNSYRDHYAFDEEKSVVDYQVFYDMDWNRQEFTQGFPFTNDYDGEIPMPKNFDKMKELAAAVSEGIPFLRADFYNLDGKIYAGEMTFYPYGGLHKFAPDGWGEKLGSMIKLY